VLHRRAAAAQDEAETLISPAPAADPSMLASELAAPCADADLAPEAGNLERVEAATLCLINQERARNGVGPLVPDGRLAQAAQAHSEDMLARDYFDHVAPDGETPLQRLLACGYLESPNEGYVIGENIAWGTLSLSTPSEIVAAWIASPEHLANILSSEFRDTGIGVVAAVPASWGGGEPGALYTQEFGVTTG
jgi:uncharacterized protein YkwD